MKFFKVLFLLSLLVSFLTAEVHAVPGKRPFEGEAKNDQPSLTIEVQTNLNRAAAERAVSDEVEEKNEVNNSSKRARGTTCSATDSSHQNNNPNSIAQDANTSSSSSTMPPNETAPSLVDRYINHEEFQQQTLESLCLKKVISLNNATSPGFLSLLSKASEGRQSGFSNSVSRNLSKQNQIISDHLQQYNISGEGNPLIPLFQEIYEHIHQTLDEKNYALMNSLNNFASEKLLTTIQDSIQFQRQVLDDTVSVGTASTGTMVSTDLYSSYSSNSHAENMIAAYRKAIDLGIDLIRHVHEETLNDDDRAYVDSLTSCVQEALEGYRQSGSYYFQAAQLDHKQITAEPQAMTSEMAVTIASAYEEYALCHLYKKQNIENEHPEIANYYGQESLCRRKTAECYILKINAQEQEQEEIASLYAAAATQYNEAGNHYNNAAQRLLQSALGVDEESIAGDDASSDESETVENDEAEAAACIEAAQSILTNIQELEG